ncbi:SDR family NAD(P)-dependent oxidoreductase [Micromonospora sp. NPDC005707]|uniref:SDR family NAD(P)-dependent oxidoreductase n=1 Tax=Micromonospora sp. NPDC005707 TaxID=3157050 RepID=UPI0033CC56ED
MSTSTTDRPLAVVTGASSGIGYELAAQFTEHGYDVVVAAEDPGIATAARNLHRDGGPEAYPVRVDLATPDGVEQLARAVTELGRPVDALALNAGRGAGGDFVGGTDLDDELKDSGVTVTSLMPGPTDTEFFDRAEMEDTRVGQGKKDDPRAVAEDAFEALMKGEHKVAAGSFMNKVQTAAGKIVPDRLKAEQHRKMAEPGSGS